jgi:hypothetical protein
MRDPRDVDLEAIAMHLGALVEPRSFPRGEGHLLRDRATGTALIAVRADLYGTQKGRFVAAHEIGHLISHPDIDALPICTGDVARLPPGARRIEGEASDGGCEILMPEAWFAPSCAGRAPALGELRALASRFDVSLSSTALRALQFVGVPCAFVVVVGGVVDWWACSAGWDVYVHRKTRVPEPSSRSGSPRRSTRRSSRRPRRAAIDRRTASARS